MRLLSTLAVSLALLASQASGSSLQDLTPRIVGGTEVNPAFKYPWLAVLTWNDQFICGGTLIDPSYILTASHCSYVGPATDLGALLHRHDLSKTSSSENGITRRIEKVIMHPNFNSDLITNDYALWKLSEPVNDVELVTLDTAGTLATVDTDATVMGWGATVYEGSASNVLLQTTIQVWDYSSCNARYNNNIVSSIQICAGTTAGGKDSCQGDSGGPLLIESGGNLIQVGVVSFGEGCGIANVPGVYARVSAGLNFISAAMNDTRTNSCASNPCPANKFCIESVDDAFCASTASPALIPSLFIALLALAFSFFRL